MSNVFDLDLLSQHFGFTPIDTLEKYADHEEFRELYEMIKDSTFYYISPIIIPILEELEVNEDILSSLVDVWMNYDESKYAAYNLILDCPYLRGKIEKLNVSDFIYLKDFIKFLSDLDDEDEIQFGLKIRDDDGCDHVSFKGNPDRAIIDVMRRNKLSNLCFMNYFKKNGTIVELPFCYVTLDYF